MFRETKWKITCCILSAIVVLGLIYYYGITSSEKDDVHPQYSVILYQNTDNEWATLIEGIKQAEEDLKVDVNYITMAKDATAEEQFEMVLREVKAGVSGILLAAVDSNRMGIFLDEADLAIPVLCVETGAGKELTTIGADDYEMGCALGRKIVADMNADVVYGSERTVTIITEYLERESVQERYEGLKSVLEAEAPKVQVVELKRREGDYNLSLFIETMFPESSCYVAALDKFSTEEAAAAWAIWRGEHEESQKQYKIYGIGNTAQTVNDLDNENIRALVYQNEFNIGYQSLEALVNDKQDEWIEENISIMYRMVTKETLYEEENERWLFLNV